MGMCAEEFWLPWGALDGGFQGLERGELLAAVEGALHLLHGIGTPVVADSGRSEHGRFQDNEGDDQGEGDGEVAHEDEAVEGVTAAEMQALLAAG